MGFTWKLVKNLTFKRLESATYDSGVMHTIGLKHNFKGEKLTGGKLR